MTEQKTPLEALEATIADFKAHPEMRIRNDLAQDARGKEVDPMDPSAVCFCAVGRYAFHRAAKDLVHKYPGQGYFDLVVSDELVNASFKIWNANDTDKSGTGEKIIPVLEGIRDRLKATLEA